MLTTTTSVTTVTRTESHATVTCDMCGAAARGSRQHEADGRVNWQPLWPTPDTTIVQREVLINDPDGGVKEAREAFHVCPACWPRLVAWIGLESGAEPTRTERVY